MKLYFQISTLLLFPSARKIQIVFVFAFFLLNVNAQQTDIRQLTIGEKIERKVTNQEVHIFSVEAKQGQVLEVNIREKGSDVTAVIARIIDEQKVSAAVNSGNGFMRETVTFVCEADGAYALVIIAQQKNETAGYEVTAALKNTANNSDTQRAKAEKLFEEGHMLFISNDKNNFPAAIAKMEEGGKIWAALGDTYWQGIAKFGVAGLAYKLGDFSKAETYLKQSLSLFEQAKDDAAIGFVCLQLGSVYAMIQNQEKANIYLTRALQIAQKIGDKSTESILSGTLKPGALNDANVGQDYLRELSEARKRNDKLAEIAIWIKALYLYVLSDDDENDEKSDFLEKAEREALPLFKSVKDKETETLMLLGLGMGYSERDDDDLRDKLESKAFNYLVQALLLSKATGSKQTESFAYMGLDSEYDSENDELAIFFGKKAVNSIQGMRLNLKGLDRESQLNYSRKAEEAYETLAEDLFYEKRFAEALQVINFNRDQEFFDFSQIRAPAISQLTLTPREAENDKLFNAELERIVAKYGVRLDSDYANAANELKIYFPKLERNFPVSAPQKETSQKEIISTPDATDMQSALRELSARTSKRYAVIYVSSDSSQILLVTSEGIKGFGIRNILEESKIYSSNLFNKIAEQVKAGTLSKEQGAKKAEEASREAKKHFDELLAEQSEERILEFLDVLRSPDFDPRPLSSIIYRRIFRKKEFGKPASPTLEAELEQYRPDVLLWSVRGDMRYIPVAALYDADKKQYLVEKYQNAVFTRARKERFLIEPKAWTQGLAFGTSVAYQVDFNGRKINLPALPGVMTEVSTIFGNAAAKRKGLFNGEAFLNRAFTRGVLLSEMQKKPPFVHIASHFMFQPGNSQNSFLLLGDGNKLSLFEMQQNPKLFEGVDLLTLSACETAATQSDADGKEIDGFAELAQRLGASSVIATLWKVSDGGTSKLMTEFYRLRQENPAAPKSEILRQAQLNVLSGKSGAQLGALRRTPSRGEVVEISKGVEKIPFKPSAESPFEHPYYWAPFVLFGSSR